MQPACDRVAVVGGGPAGLMAAEALCRRGIGVDLYEAMPSVGRKFLMAGRGGLNLTHAEPFPALVSRYGDRQAQVSPWLDAFSPGDLRAWAADLGVDTFVGTSGRVFPTEMKAAPLLRAWLHRLRAHGVRVHVRHRWLGWAADGALRFDTPAGEVQTSPVATVLALGGGSWAKLGSDGRWVAALTDAGVAVAPLRPANCGFDVGWSPFFSEHFAGHPLKSLAITFGAERRVGECVVTQHGLEGSLVYAFAARLRDAIEANGHATLHLDLLPDRRPDQVLAQLERPRGSRSLASHLQSRLGLKGVKAALLRECLTKEQMQNPAQLASAIKALPVRLVAPRPIDEAISTAGGVTFDTLDAQLMLRSRPGVFCAGEMLDWEAPTGGYLLTACMGSGKAAGEAAADFVAASTAAAGRGQ